MANILSIDYGRKKIGLALADSEMRIAMPIRPISVSRNKTPVQCLVSKIKELAEVELLVIGYPAGPKGIPTPMSKEVTSFAEEVKNQTNIEYTLVDETLTSAVANANSTSSKRNKANQHSLVAVMILEQYFESQNER